mmetsp:Transcript_13562/g.22151  ORF Transcript_13562/g.22151 Transcript_13562/m.22151 type:complete len:207 (-) Transcript_13562:608-1228(-)|eukprot:CAMPEP_0203766778 /NCGR_PEP_ID=MMETSP0099_2-20121227/614_1 /ASSEMBLY_ACC=CAM_ASM_000209 /TAXON_ID=96639 /ORGANISM=" , Strain NY0313808BC1" /LENGTH=206 /DNA_ID=CAMNT_0050663181 /DNA_START=117 /DNA_END=737 /DNA_ORIENTATION=+
MVLQQTLHPLVSLPGTIGVGWARVHLGKLMKRNFQVDLDEAREVKVLAHASVHAKRRMTPKLSRKVLKREFVVLRLSYHHKPDTVAFLFFKKRFWQGDAEEVLNKKKYLAITIGHNLDKLDTSFHNDDFTNVIYAHQTEVQKLEENQVGAITSSYVLDVIKLPETNNVHRFKSWKIAFQDDLAHVDLFSLRYRSLLKETCSKGPAK